MSLARQLKFPVALLFCAALGLASSGPLRAATVDWIAPAADTYSNSAAWSNIVTFLPGVPGALDTARIGNATIPNGSVLYTNAPPDPACTNALNSLLFCTTPNTTGDFTMNSGTLSITNTGASAFYLGWANPSTATFTMNGGVLNVVRNASTFYQDSFQLGVALNSDGTFTLNDGTATFLCGTEIGIQGKGTINVNGGTLINNGWFGVGRGNSATSPGWGIFNLSGGTVYLLRNPGTDGSTPGLFYGSQGTNGTVSISGGALYTYAIRFGTMNNALRTFWETLNVSGGDLYIGAQGILNANGAGTHVLSVQFSGGTFRTVNLGPNTGGTQGLASVLTDGADWTWRDTVPAELTTTPGPGYVTFAPEANRTITLSNVFSGAGGLVLAGPGKLAINGANTYSGPTTITGGTVSGFGSVSGNVTNTAATVAPGSPTAPGTLTLGSSLTLNGATNLIKLSADPYNIGNGVNDLLVVNGDLVLQNVSKIKIVPLAPLSTDVPYTVLQYGGTPLTAAYVAAHLQVISDSARYSFSIVDPATTYPYIQISVTGNAANLTWRGGKAPAPSAWDHTTTNWWNSGSSAFDVFYDGDATIFDDTAATNWVNLVGAQQPATISMQNNSLAFTLAGDGPLGGALDMQGTAPLTLAMSAAPAFTSIANNTGALVFNLANASVNTINANISDGGGGAGALVQGGTNTVVLAGANSSYFGGIQVTNGVLRYTSTAGLGSGSTLYATNNGTLDFNRVSVFTKSLVVSGAGFNGQGALNESLTSGNSSAVFGYLTLAGDTTIGSSGRWDQFATDGTITGNGYKLIKVGQGSVWFKNAGDTGFGEIDLAAGRFGFEANITLGLPSNSMIVRSNAALTFFSGTSPFDKILTLEGTAIMDSGGAANTFAGPITLGAGQATFLTRSDLHLSGALGGIGGLIAATNATLPLGVTPNSGNGVLYLEGVSTYSGRTTLNQGSTVIVGAGSSLGSSALVVLNNASTLDLSAHATYNFGSGQTLAGVGTVVGGTINLASGSSLAVGLTPGATSSMTVIGNLTLQSGSTNWVKLDAGTPGGDLVTGLTSVTYGGTLVLSNISASPLTAGMTFQLFSAATYNPSSFATIVPADPGPGLLWDTSRLTVDGTLKVVASAPPQFTSISPLGDGNFQFNFTGAVDSHYTLLASTNVALPLGSWTVLSSGTINASPLTVQDLTATNYPRRFYTISVP